MTSRGPTISPRRTRSLCHGALQDPAVRSLRPQHPTSFTRLLLLCILLTNTMPYTATGTRVLSFQPDTWIPPRSDVFARYNFTRGGGGGGGGGEGGGGGGGGSSSRSSSSVPLASFSICYRIRLLLFRPSYNTHISVAMSPEVTNQFVFGMAAKYSLYYNDKYQPVSEDMNNAFTLNRWTHFCHVTAGSLYTLYADGVEVVRGRLVGDTTMKFNGTLILGQEQDTYSGGFDPKQSLCGFIAQMNIYDHSLTVGDVRELHRCEVDTPGQVFSLDRDAMEMFDVEVSEVDLSELCKAEENVVIFPKEMTLRQSTLFCEQFGASLYLPETLRKTNRLFNTSREFFEACNPGDYSFFWLAATDKKAEGQWRHFVTNELLRETHFEDGQPNGGLNENCVTLSKNSGLWVDFPCTVDKRHCFSCKFVESRPLYLRGLCELTRKRTAGYLLGYIEGFPYYQGFYQYIIYYSNITGWTLFDSVSNETIATLALKGKIVFPIGRNMWHLESEKCDVPSQDLVELSVSPCDDTQYMCANGYCIARSDRCDLKDDCPDGSDEGRCSQVRMSPGYRKHQPPTPPQKNSSLPIKAFVDIKRFSTVNDVDSFTALEMQIELMWTDSRVQFLNTRWNQEANIMSAEEAKSIWKPTLRFLNVQEGNIELLDEETMVRRNGEPSHQDFNSVETDYVFSGDSCFLLRRLYYHGKFTCDFQVFVYPFDEQRCTVSFKMTGINREMVAFDEQLSLAAYSGDPFLSAYLLTQVYVVIPPGDNTQSSVLEVHFILVRRYGLLVLTMLIPTLMLVTIGYSTLFVGVPLVQVRLVVSLTTLLVLYTLYNQTAATLPTTAYVKMIDVWFFSCIFLLFIIILFHVLVEHIHSSGKTPAMTLIKVGSGAPSLNLTEPTCTASGLNKLIRKWIVPLLFLLFMLVFWIVMIVSW